MGQRQHRSAASYGYFGGSYRPGWTTFLLLIALATPGANSAAWGQSAGPDDGRRAYTLETVALFGAPLNLFEVSMPLIDNSGNVIFFATTWNGSSSSSGSEGFFYRKSGGVLETLLKPGDTIAALDDAVVAATASSRAERRAGYWIGGSGEALFSAFLEPDATKGVTSENRYVLLRGKPGDLSVVYRGGDPLDTSGALLTTAREAHLNGNGTVSFVRAEDKGRLVLSKTDHTPPWATLVKSGDTVGGCGTADTVVAAAGNGAGTIGWVGITDHNILSFAVCKSENGEFKELAKVPDLIPQYGGAWRYGDFSTDGLALNDSGDMAFWVTGPFGSFGGEGIFKHSFGGSLSLSARASSPAPGTPFTFWYFGDPGSSFSTPIQYPRRTPALNDRGEVAFMARTNYPTDGHPTEGIWAEVGDSLKLIVRDGDRFEINGQSCQVRWVDFYRGYSNYGVVFRADFEPIDGCPTAGIFVARIMPAPPRPADQSITTDEDTAAAITLAASSTTETPLSFEVVSTPQHGDLSGTAPNLTYTPRADFYGTDSFKFSVSDGTARSLPATVSVTVRPVNDPPVAHSMSVSTSENTPFAIQLEGTDVDGDVLLYAVAIGPTHGTLAQTGANVTYTPDTGHIGPDSFTFTVSDGQAIATGTISITVVPRSTVTFVAGPNGDISTNGSLTQSVPYGGSTTEFTAIPDAGYHFANWTDQSGTEVSRANPFALTNVTANMTITANFAPNPINGICGAIHGKTLTAPPTTDLCAAGAASAVTEWDLGKYYGAGWSWTCSGLHGGSTANCKAYVASYTVTFVAGPNGSVWGQLIQWSVRHGASTIPVTASPDAGYHLVSWTDQGGTEVGRANPFVLTNVTATMTITANFAPNNPVDGGCGAANGRTVTAAPATDLCATGTASAISGAGPWSWTCTGLYGGATANCSAALQPLCVPPPAGLVSWWPASGTAGDIIGGKNGTLVNGATYATGKVDEGFSVNGTQQYVALPDSTLPGGSAWTVGAWFKTASGGVIIGMQNGPYGATLNTGVSTWDPLLFVGTDGKLRGGIWPGQLVSNQSVADGTWHHAAIAYDNGTVRMYLDGALSKSASGVTPQPMPVNQIGTGYTAYWDAGNNGWFDFNGQIDEVALFSRALSAAGIQKVYTAGANGICRAPSRDFDTSFTGRGFVVSDLAQDWSGARAVALQRDGKIVVAGYKGGGGKLLVARYLPDGTLDPDFGEGKGYVTPIDVRSQAYGLALYNGKIVVVGDYPRGGDWQVLVVMLTESGALDTTFGGTGFVTWNNGWYSAAAGVAIQNGKILVTGVTDVDYSDYDLLLLRYNLNGTLDTSFGPDQTGVVTVPAMVYDGSLGGDPVRIPNVEGTAVVVQPWDGKIDVVTQSGFPDHAALFRFTPTGSIDTAFGVNGMTMPYHGTVTGTDGSYGGKAAALALQRDHKILMAGMGFRDPGGTSAVVLRYTEEGQIDPTYGAGGEGSYTTSSGSGIWGLAIQDDGKSVVVGTIAGQVHPGNDNAQSDVGILRFTAQGSLDTNFGTGGVVLFNGPLNKTDEGRAVAIDPDGKIVVAGETQKEADTASRDTLLLRVKGTSDGVLLSDLSAVADRIPVDDIIRFPEWGIVQIEGELIVYKGKKSAVSAAIAGSAAAGAAQPGYLLIMHRGANGTVPADHTAGAAVALVAAPSCSGDCNASGEVTIDEILTAVNIALGNASPEQCSAVDTNTDGQVTVNEVLGGVDNALNGCCNSVP